MGINHRRQHRSFGDSAGINPLKPDGLGFGTAELFLSQYWFRNNYPDCLVIPRMYRPYPAFASFPHAAAAKPALVLPLIRCSKHLRGSCLFWITVRVLPLPPPCGMGGGVLASNYHQSEQVRIWNMAVSYEPSDRGMNHHVYRNASYWNVPSSPCEKWLPVFSSTESHLEWLSVTGPGCCRDQIWELPVTAALTAGRLCNCGLLHQL